MSAPLPLSYAWQPPVLFASVGAAVLAGAVARGEGTGRATVLALIVVLWVGFLVLVWLRTRAYLSVDGAELTVRRYRGLHRVRGDQLVAVQQVRTPSGPCYRLVVREPDGGLRRLVAPVARRRSGHATLFDWILATAPKAELDRGTRRTLDRLRAGGQVR